MKLKLLILFLLITYIADAQKIRFSNPGNQWVAHYHDNLSGFGCDWRLTFTFVTKPIDTVYLTDTIVSSPLNTSTFCEYEGPYNWFETHIREDTVAGIVYFAKYHGEGILYNYNLQVGDTISYFLDSGSHRYFVDTVKSLDSILINGIYHKLFEFSGVFIDSFDSTRKYLRKYTVLEGIGCLGDPFYPVERIAPNCLRLLCFSQNGVSPEIHIPAAYYCDINGYAPFTNSIGCTILGTATTIKADDKYVISPNPATEYVTISNPAGFAANSLFTVYDYTGRAITKHTLTTGATQEVINIATWLPGLYLINIQNGNTNVWQKVVVGR